MRRIAGNYLAIEGIDGAGKTSALAVASARLAERDLAHVQYHDPGRADPVGRLARLSWQQRQSFEEETLHLLFAAASIQAQADARRAADAQGAAIIISDRSPFSSYAYMPSLEVDHFIAVHAAFWAPRLTLMVEIAPELAAERLQGRGAEAEEIEDCLLNAEAIQNRYEHVLAISHRWGAATSKIVVDRNTSVADVADRIVTQALQLSADHQ